MKQCVTQDSTQREYIQCLYSAMSGHTQSAQTWITQCYLQIAPCLPFVSPSVHQMAPLLIEMEDIWWRLANHLSTPNGWKAELAWLVDLWWMVYRYPHKWLPIGYRSNAGQLSPPAKRPTFYCYSTQPFVLCLVHGHLGIIAWLKLVYMNKFCAVNSVREIFALLVGF